VSWGRNLSNEDAGAWCANLVFMRDDARATVLYPVTARAERCAWNSLGSIFGLPVQDVYGEITARTAHRAIHWDFSVPEDEFRALLDWS
jgi:hypothetical protein